MQSRTAAQLRRTRAIEEDHDAIVTALAGELIGAFERAAGNERSVRDVVFLFTRRLQAARVTARWIPEIFGAAIARSPLSASEREIVFRMFPRCDQLAPQRSPGRARWWQLTRLPVRRTVDIGQQPI